MWWVVALCGWVVYGDDVVGVVFVGCVGWVGVFVGPSLGEELV